jgi:hypothetical protein
MPQDFHPGLAHSPLKDQEDLFPRPELDPAATVVEVRDNSISTGERPDRLQDATLDRVRAPARRALRLAQ